MSATYMVITDSYIAGAKDGYLEFGEVPDDKRVGTSVEYAQSFIDHAQSVNTLSSVPDDHASTQNWSDYLQFTISTDESGCLTAFSYNERVMVKPCQGQGQKKSRTTCREWADQVNFSQNLPQERY
jgi:hypothetical protein